jgi:glycosyltransferase involved in cell wall biosynthesis
MPQVSGAAELIGSGDAGVVIERNPASIAHVVAELAHDDTRRMAMQRAARATVERSYNWDTVAAQTSALYERLLERRQQEVTRN